jgi:hypothetical protein
MKKLTPEDMGLGPDATTHQGPNYQVELWARAAINGSHLDKSSPAMMQAALSSFAEDEVQLDLDFLFRIIETCVTNDMDGSLSAILDIAHLREKAAILMTFFFWEAANHDAVAVMELIWKTFVESDDDSEVRKTEVTNSSRAHHLMFLLIIEFAVSRFHVQGYVSATPCR